MSGKCWLFAIALLCLATPPRVFSQAKGMSKEELATWYHLSQGTEFFPLGFFLALNDADTGEPFSKNLERFGFIADPKGPKNPFGLPVGMTAEETRDLRFKNLKMIGINCAACHTAVFEIGGQPVLRADGGTNMFDPQRFRASLIKSAEKTINNPVELVRFVSRLVRGSTRERLDVQSTGESPDKEGGLTSLLTQKLSERLESLFDAVDGPQKQPGSALTLMLSQQILASGSRRSSRNHVASWRCCPCSDVA